MAIRKKGFNYTTACISRLARNGRDLNFCSFWNVWEKENKARKREKNEQRLSDALWHAQQQAVCRVYDTHSHTIVHFNSIINGIIWLYFQLPSTFWKEWTLSNTHTHLYILSYYCAVLHSSHSIHDTLMYSMIDQSHEILCTLLLWSLRQRWWWWRWKWWEIKRWTGILKIGAILLLNYIARHACRNCNQMLSLRCLWVLMSRKRL
jgi:hypothetical protein